MKVISSFKNKVFCFHFPMIWSGLCVFFVSEMDSFCSPVWLGTCSVDHGGVKLRDPPASSSWD